MVTAVKNIKAKCTITEEMEMLAFSVHYCVVELGQLKKEERKSNQTKQKKNGFSTHTDLLLLKPGYHFRRFTIQ